MNNITEISDTDFAHLSELLEIILSGNPITRIHHQAFLNNTKLTHLYLDYTELMAPPELSGAKYSLQYLSVDNSKIKNVSGHYFSNISSLQSIIFDYNELSSVTIGNLEQLENISISNNVLTTMPNLLVVLPKLTHIYIESNQIGNISHAYFNNTPNLVYLDIDRNLLTVLPNLEPVLSSIQDIHMRHNDITSENVDQIARLPALRNIHLGGNKLTNITFGESDNLRWMYIYSNHLTKMPTLTHTLPALKHIHVGSNEHLSYIHPEYFNKTPALTHLFLYHTNMHTVPNLTYCSDTLKYLDLYSTDLVYPELHYEDFTLGRNFKDESHIFHNLEYLRLSYNDITKFSPRFFDGFPNLQKLECGECGLTEFPNISRLSG